MNTERHGKKFKVFPKTLKDERLLFRLEDELLKRTKQAAAKAEMPVSEFVRKALERHLAEGDAED